MATVVKIDEAQEPLNPTLNSTSSNEPLQGELDGDLYKFATNSKFSFRNFSFKQIYLSHWRAMRSWGSFIDTNKMNLPTSTVQWSKRFIKNLEHFQSNYLFVIVLLMIYCVLTSPFLLLFISAYLGACYLITLKNKQTPVKIFNYQLSLTQQYVAVSIVSFPLFLLGGVGSVVFWVIGASLFIIGLHASTYAIESIPTGTTNNQLFEPFPPLSSVESI